MASIEAEYSETLAYPVAAVFAALTDLAGRKKWQPDIVDTRVDPAGPAQLGSTLRESRKFKGHETESTLEVTVCDLNRYLTLETSGDAKQTTSERYQLEQLSEDTCRLRCRIEMDGVPIIAQILVRQAMTKQLPHYVEQLKNVIENGAHR